MKREDIDKRFTRHPPRKVLRVGLTQQQRYQQITEASREFAHLINKLAPDGREKALALTNLEAVRMRANMAIAVGEADEPENVPPA